jgi:hypothetical protein
VSGLGIGHDVVQGGPESLEQQRVAVVDAALGLAPNCASTYRSAAPHLRRQLNQAFFERLLVDDDTIEGDMAAPFGLLLGQDLAVDARSFAMRPHTIGRKNEEPAIPEGMAGGSYLAMRVAQV